VRDGYFTEDVLVCFLSDAISSIIIRRDLQSQGREVGKANADSDGSRQDGGKDE